MKSGSLGIRFNQLGWPVLFVSKDSASYGNCIPVRDVDNVTEDDVYTLIQAYEASIDNQVAKLRARYGRVSNLTPADIFRF